MQNRILWKLLGALAVIFLVGGTIYYGLSMATPVTTAVPSTPPPETALPVYTTIPAESAQTVYTTAPTEGSADIPTATSAPSVTLAPLPGDRRCIATANLMAVGNILPATPMIKAAMQEENIYDFHPFFQYLGNYIQKADFAVGTLETPLGGQRSAGYTGAPLYNAPDTLAEALKDAGFDALCTATNHVYDSGSNSFKRTTTTVQEYGMYALGSVAATDEPNYLIKDINGIKVGMIAYTFESDDEYEDTPSLNSIILSKADMGLVNTYHPVRTNAFLEKMQLWQTEMTKMGVDITMLFIHWGDQYSFLPNQHQQNLAQRLCDMGIDVIVGSHPHVIQAPTLLTNRLDTREKTLVLYALGNTISNQRRGYIPSLKSAHTEDGLLASLTFNKYSDRTTYLEGFQVIPLWTNLRSSENPAAYTVLPLENTRRGNWTVDYGLSDRSFTEAKQSVERTEALVNAAVSNITEKLQTAMDSRNTPPETTKQK